MKVLVAAQNPVEMERIRNADAKLRQEQAKKFVPEANRADMLCYFEIGRYVAGPFRGLFVVNQLIKDKKDKPVRKCIAEGVDMVVAMSNLETAIRRRVFR